MVDSKNLNGVTAAADDLEKGEVLDSQEQQDLEEGEDYEAEEGDLEKRPGEVHEIDVSELLQPLLTAQETEHHELAAASTPLVAMEKVIVSLIVISFVLVEAYFVGRSFRQWHSDEHVHGKPMNSTEFFPTSLPLEQPLLTPIDGIKESLVIIPEPFEDFLEGNLNSGEGLGRKGLFDSALAKMSTRTTPLAPGVVVDSTSPQLPVVPMKEEATISEQDDGKS